MTIFSFSKMHINSRGRLLENNLLRQNKKATLLGFEPATLKTKVHVRITVSIECATRPYVELGAREDMK